MGTQTKHPLLCTPSSLRLSSPLASCCRCWATLGRPSPCLLAGPQAGDEAGLPALGSRADAPGVTGGCRPLAPSRAGSRHCPQTWTLSKQGGAGGGDEKAGGGDPQLLPSRPGSPSQAHERATCSHRARPVVRNDGRGVGGARVRVLLRPAMAARCSLWASATPRAAPTPRFGGVRSPARGISGCFPALHPRGRRKGEGCCRRRRDGPLGLTPGLWSRRPLS